MDRRGARVRLLLPSARFDSAPPPSGLASALKERVCARDPSDASLWREDRS